MGWSEEGNSPREPRAAKPRKLNVAGKIQATLAGGRAAVHEAPLEVAGVEAGGAAIRAEVPHQGSLQVQVVHVVAAPQVPIWRGPVHVTAMQSYICIYS